jgi:hypothetical protein
MPTATAVDWRRRIVLGQIVRRGERPNLLALTVAKAVEDALRIVGIETVDVFGFEHLLILPGILFRGWDQPGESGPSRLSSWQSCQTLPSAEPGTRAPRSLLSLTLS